LIAGLMGKGLRAIPGIKAAARGQAVPASR